MTTATTKQLAKIHVLLGRLALLDDKKDIILDASAGRTDSSKFLTVEEARRLISRLAEYDPGERLKSLIFSLGYQTGIIYGSTPDDKKMNAAKLNAFLKERGTVKKELNAMHYTELVKTHRQFEAIVKSVKTAQLNKQADMAVKHLLTELEGIY